MIHESEYLPAKPIVLGEMVNPRADTCRFGDFSISLRHQIGNSIAASDNSIERRPRLPGGSMSSYSIFLVLFGAYIFFLIATGYYFNRRQKTVRDFLLAGKSAGTFSIGFSAAASWLTAGAMLAVIGFFILLGMGSVWGFVAPNIIALLIIALLVKKIRSIPAMTQPELLEIRYGSFIRTPVAMIIIVVMILFAVADIKGFAMVLQIFYGISNLQAALIVGLSVAVYVTLGGLSAVIASDTVQFLCLSFFVLIFSVLVMGNGAETSSQAISTMVTTTGADWWNPLSIGLPMVLIFSVAIIPGWITEQDPWQKVWAARDSRSARNGMLFGSLLVTLVFGGCAFIALGLRNIYPDIAAAGFPMGMAQAEPALLHFIVSQNYSDIIVALCAVALAAAAMSCADTFAASGASCVARDIYQRLFHPAASMSEMMLVNRLSVLLIIACATIGSFLIDSIIDAIHIATFIASASYFFALMGGMYWKGGTAAGAGASMCTGFLSQCAFVAYDLFNTLPGAPPALEAVHPILMGHGVIVAMAVSGLVYVGVSLVTAPSPTFRLAPFFADEGKVLAAAAPQNNFPEPVFPREMTITERVEEDQIYLRAQVILPRDLTWQSIVNLIPQGFAHWIVFSGQDSIRRCTEAEIQSCVSFTCGETVQKGYLEIEGYGRPVHELKRELARAYDEIMQSAEAPH